MAYDYADDVAFAIESVAEYGRPVRFLKVAPALDPANPLGPAPGAAPVPSDPVLAVFVPLSSNNSLGMSRKTVELMKNSDSVLLIAPSTVDYEEQTHLIDADGSKWIVDVTDKLMPGNTAVLFFLGVSRA